MQKQTAREISSILKRDLGLTRERNHIDAIGLLPAVPHHCRRKMTEGYPWYSLALRGAFYCDATSKTLNAYARARIPFALVGDPLFQPKSELGRNDRLYQNNQAEMEIQKWLVLFAG